VDHSQRSDPLVAMPPSVASKSAKKGSKPLRTSSSSSARKVRTPAKPSQSKGRQLSGRVVAHRRETLKEVSTVTGVTASAELKYRARGYKCVTEGTRSLVGVHPALLPVCANFEYDHAKANGTLLAEELDTAQYTESVPPEIPQDGIAKSYTCKDGQTLDRQIGQIVAWHHKRGVRAPLPIFYDEMLRQRFFNTSSIHKQGPSYAPILPEDVKSIKKLCATLLPETLHVVHYCHTRKYDMVATQVCVAQGRLGTRLDLLLKTEQGTYIVVELKRGCQKAYTEGKFMSFPFRSMMASTHNEYLLQTMLNRRLFQNTYPTAKLCEKKPCMLLRMDREGLHEYYPPAEMLKNEQKLASVLRC
jgi:hypothetical protein